MRRPSVPSRDAAATGAGAVLLAYLLWGVFPLYFLQLAPSNPFEIVSWRILLSLVFCALLLTITRGWGALARIVRQPRLVGWMALAGLLIYVNWQTYLVATLEHRVIETSLGYFINPLVTVLLGVVVLRERLRPVQWASIGIASIAIVVIVVGYGAFPVIALTLAFSFGFYGLVKKRVGTEVDAVSGLTLETAWLAPLAAVQLAVVAATTGLTMGTAGPAHAVLLSLAGVVTAVPLLLFAAGARRVPLTVVGLLQFIAPVLQFVIGAAVLGEEMTPSRWTGFALVWVSLIVLSIDSVAAARRRRRGGEVGIVV